MTLSKKEVNEFKKLLNATPKEMLKWTYQEFIRLEELKERGFRK